MTRSRSAEATIKGFNYQFDATIKEILSNSGPIVIEGVEDIDLHDERGLTECVQCKYYEATNLTNSVLREIIKPMLRHFKINGATKYTIYGHFKSINIVNLDKPSVEIIKEEVLRYTSKGVPHDLVIELDLSDTEILEFISCLQLKETTDYATHKVETKTEIDGAFRCRSFETENFYYCNAFSLIAELATKSNIADRTITKDEFLAKINTKEKLYSYWTLIEKGESEFCRKVRREHFTQSNISPYARIFVIHVNEQSNTSDLKSIVLELSRKWSNTWASRATTRYAPYIYFHGLSEDILIDLKNNLYDEGNLFVDGYPYKGATFSWSAISEQANPNKLIKFRIFHNVEELQKLINDLTNKTKEIYEFYYDKELIDLGHNIKHVKIPINSLSMIQNII